MVFRKKKPVEEPEETQEAEEEEEEKLPEIEPAVKPKTIKEKIVVVYELPQRPVAEEVIDGVLVKYMTVAEALTEVMNQEE